MKASLTALAVACTAGATWGQATISYPTTREDYEVFRAEREAEYMRQQRARENERFKRESEVRRSHRATSLRPAPPARKMTDEHKRRLYPTEAERASFAALLREDGTGLMRLLPYTGCAVDPRIFNVNGSCIDQVPPVRGGGSFYSFRDEKYHRAPYADIGLRDDLFNVGFMEHTLGLLAPLGDLPLDAVTLQTEGVRPFLKFVPAKTLAETEREFKRRRPWLEVPRYTYGSSAPVRENATYVLRSIAFGPDRGKPSDVLVAFRVTRKDADGAVTIVWKQLQKPKK
jgi:hypothetical protein